MFPKYKALTNEGSIFKSSKVEQKIKTDLFLRRLAAFAYEHLWTSLWHKVVLWQHRGFPLLQRQNFISFDRGNGRKVLGNRCARNRIVKTMTIVITMLCRYSHNRKSWKHNSRKHLLLFCFRGRVLTRNVWLLMHWRRNMNTQNTALTSPVGRSHLFGTGTILARSGGDHILK